MNYGETSRLRRGTLSTFRGKKVIFPRQINWSSIRTLRAAKVLVADEYRPDLISLRHYGRADIGWAILDYNLLDDPAELYAGRDILIPELGALV